MAGDVVVDFPLVHRVGTSMRYVVWMWIKISFTKTKKQIDITINLFKSQRDVFKTLSLELPLRL